MKDRQIGSVDSQNALLKVSNRTLPPVLLSSGGAAYSETQSLGMEAMEQRHFDDMQPMDHLGFENIQADAPESPAPSPFSKEKQVLKPRNIEFGMHDK